MPLAQPILPSPLRSSPRQRPSGLARSRVCPKADSRAGGAWQAPWPLARSGGTEPAGEGTLNGRWLGVGRSLGAQRVQLWQVCPAPSLAG